MEKMLFIVSTYLLIGMQWAVTAIQYEDYVDSTFEKYLEKVDN